MSDTRVGSVELVNTRLMGSAESTQKRIDDLLEAIDCQPPRAPTRPVEYSESVRLQVEESKRIIRLIEYAIPDDLRDVYGGVLELTRVTSGTFCSSLMEIKADTQEMANAQWWLSNNYDIDSSVWLLALAYINLAFLYPDCTVTIRDYHGSDAGADRIDKVLKDITIFYPYLHERFVFMRDSFLFRPDRERRYK